MGRIFCRAGTAALAAALGLAAAGAPGALAAERGWADGSWYVGLNAPVMFIDDTESTTTGSMVFGQPPASIPYRAMATSEHRTGFKVAGVLGYELGGGLRVEGELFFARAEIDRLTYRGVSSPAVAEPPMRVNIPISGTADQFGGLANVWYDIDTGTEWIPYVGGGIGFLRVDQGELDYDANALAQSIVARIAPGVTLPPGFVPEISTVDTTFVYHFGAGLGYPLTDSVTLQAGYRFQIGSDLGFDARNRMGKVEVETDMRIHFLEIGLRYRF